MHKITGLAVAMMIASAMVTISVAQNVATEQPKASVKDPSGPHPNPANIPIADPAKIVWERTANGEQQAKLFGDPSKPGIYGILIRWEPGHYSHPHFHDQDRFIYVISGTWWVSSSSHFDPSKTYPLPTGSYAEDIANTIHWDGARAGGPPAILELVGMGPVKTVPVGEDGKPLPSAKAP